MRLVFAGNLQLHCRTFCLEMPLRQPSRILFVTGNQLLGSPVFTSDFFLIVFEPRPRSQNGFPTQKLTTDWPMCKSTLPFKVPKVKFIFQTMPAYLRQADKEKKDAAKADGTKACFLVPIHRLIISRYIIKSSKSYHMNIVSKPPQSYSSHPAASRTLMTKTM